MLIVEIVTNVILVKEKLEPVCKVSVGGAGVGTRLFNVNLPKF